MLDGRAHAGHPLVDPKALKGAIITQEYSRAEITSSSIRSES